MNYNSQDADAHEPDGELHDKKPLSGLKIIDAGSIIAGPLATSLMADFGAEVISIEHPEGDPVRDMNPKQDDVSLVWKVYHRNKRAITLDLSTDKGGSVLKDLVKDSDVIVENFRPGTMEKWGLGYEELSANNEDLIMVRISGFGQTGPYRERAGFGRVAGAMGGMVNLIGEPDNEPIFPSYPLEDGIAGLYAAYGTMVAVFNQRFSSGGGQVVDLSMAESVLHTNGIMPLEYDQLGNIPTRHGNTQPNVAPNSVYETADDEYIVIPASNHNAWQNLCQAMDRTDLLENEKFIDNKSRVEHSAEINGIVRDWINNHSSEKVEAIFDEYDVIYAFMHDIKDIENDDHFQARDTFTRVDDEELGEGQIQDVVPRLSETPGEVTHLGPQKGKHNKEVFRGELGYSEEQMKNLKESDII